MKGLHQERMVARVMLAERVKGEREKVRPPFPGRQRKMASRMMTRPHQRILAHI